MFIMMENSSPLLYFDSLFLSLICYWFDELLPCSILRCARQNTPCPFLVPFPNRINGCTNVCVAFVPSSVGSPRRQTSTKVRGMRQNCDRLPLFIRVFPASHSDTHTHTRVHQHHWSMRLCVFYSIVCNKYAKLCLSLSPSVSYTLWRVVCGVSISRSVSSRCRIILPGAQ